MPKTKPPCPSCGSRNFRIRQTFAISGKCHELERKRYAYYECAECGCRCVLYTPQGTLEIIRDGVVTQEQAKRVLTALNLPQGLAKRLNR